VGELFLQRDTRHTRARYTTYQQDAALDVQIAIRTRTGTIDDSSAETGWIVVLPRQFPVPTSGGERLAVSTKGSEH
jgi:hypothetical protein